MANCAMALHKLSILTASSHTSMAFWIAVLCVTLSYSISMPESVPVLGTRAFCKHWAPVLGAYDLVGVLFPSQSGYSPPCFCSFINLMHIAMPRKWPRIGSRRGGSHGRATSQRSTPISPSSLHALEPERSSPLVTRSSRGRGCGCGRMADCEHASHPTIRYCIPCTLANSTFIVSVTIEKCEDLRGQVVAHPEIPAD